MSGVMVTLSQFGLPDFVRYTDATGAVYLGAVILTGIIDTLWITSSTHENIKESLTDTTDRTYRIYSLNVPIIIDLPKPPVFPEKPGEPLPLPEGWSDLGQITEVCDLVGQGTHGNFFYNFRNRYTDQQDSWQRDMQETIERAKRHAICQGKAPPTAKDWQDSIQKQVTAGFDALSKYVTDGLKSVTGSWQNGLMDLEARLKAWISDMILEILLKKLMEGRKDDSHR